MKFTLSILALLAIAFLVGCSAKDTSNDIGKAELTELSKKYSGTYVFSRKFESEIRQREKKRQELSQELGNKIRSNPRKIKNGNEYIIIYDIDMTPVDQKFPQTLSNGKKYYTSTRSYEQDYKKAVNVSKKYINEVINFIGQEDYNKFKPSIDIGYFYVDNDEIVPIELSATYSYQGTKFGFFGDEGRGFALSRDEIYTVKGGNRFYLEDMEKR